MLRLHKPVLAAVALLALTAAGCGSSDSKSSSTATTANGKTNTNKKAAGDKKKGKREKQDPNACGKKGITPETTTEGTCAQGKGSQKHDVTYVNGDGTLKLKEL